MSLIDLLALIVENLNRRKARVALTAIGVIIGTSAVVILVSLAIGLQRNATEQLWGINQLSQIRVWPGYTGDMVVMGPGGAMQQPNQILITNQTLEDLAAIPGVQQVIPMEGMMVGGTIKLGSLESYPGMNGVGVKDLSELGLKAREGTTELSKGKMVVGSMVNRNFYNPRQRPGDMPADPPNLMGEMLKVTLIRYTQDGQEMRRMLQVEVVGVLEESRDDSDYSMYMTMEDVTGYNEWGFGRRINRNKDGYQQAIVLVEDPKSVMDISDAITTMGYQAYTPSQYVQGINSFYVILQVVFGGVGAIALLVAAIGIANTMAMAILERTREIGLMKAIGATNRDVLSVFLGEAAGIGFIGGVGGVLIGWSLGQIINVLAVAYMAGQVAQTGGAPPTVAVYTPGWLPPSTLVFATLIGLLSGLYPALRAANLIPVNALKYE